MRGLRVVEALKGTVKKAILLQADADVVKRCDMLVLASGADKDTVRVISDTCAVLIAAEGFKMCGIDAESCISFGMSTKNTLTVSSIGESSTILAIQREITTLNGNVLERQELSYGEIPAEQLMDFLALCASLLVLNIPPERILPCF